MASLRDTPKLNQRIIVMETFVPLFYPPDEAMVLVDSGVEYYVIPKYLTDEVNWEEFSEWEAYVDDVECYLIPLGSIPDTGLAQSLSFFGKFLMHIGAKCFSIKFHDCFSCDPNLVPTLSVTAIKLSRKNARLKPSR